MEPRTIFLMGKPGCGKGTQAKLLAEKTGWSLVTAGNQFRAMATEDSPLGRKVKSEVDAGILTPYWLATYLYLKSLFALKNNESVVFDGFNRRVEEAAIAVESLRWLGRPFVIINIQVSNEVVQKRLAIRKDIEGRADDNVVDQRLKEYEEHSAPALEMYRDAGIVVEVNGEKTPEEIAADIRAVLNLA